MTKNPVKLLRNPNSPEAIQARLDGYAQPPFESTQIIDDPDAKLIIIDLTEDKVDQRVNYALTGGTKPQMERKLVRASLYVDDQGRPILTSYYTDVRNHQWLVIKQIHDKFPVTGNVSSIPPRFHPTATYGATFGGFFSSAKGETWINEGRSIKKLNEAHDRIINNTPVDPNSNQDRENPTDHFYDDFTGQH